MRAQYAIFETIAHTARKYKLNKNRNYYTHARKNTKPIYYPLQAYEINYNRFKQSEYLLS